MIKINNLNKYFYRRKNNEIHVINDTSLTFPETGLVAILGESGSGKTTLMNVVGGLDSFESGTISYDDEVVTKYSSKVIDKIRNEKIGYIFQNYLLLTNRTVKYNLELALEMYSLDKETQDERINYVLTAVGMLKYKNKKVSELSGGQQQRVAIARALIKSPSLILADEPTGNLDEKNTIQIMNIIKKVSQKTLVILVSHEKRMATAYADTIVEVSDGKVVKVTNLNGNGTYKMVDDQTIYLQEYNKTTLTSDDSSIELYSNETNNLDLKIIYENGRFYLSSTNPLVIVDKDSEIIIKDEKRKDLDVDNTVNLNDYELESLTYKRTPKLPFKERINLARTNLKQNKRRRVFLSIVLFMISALTLLCVESIAMAKKIDYEGIGVSDSRIYDITFSKKDPLMDNASFEEIIKEFITDFKKEIKEPFTLDYSYDLIYTFNMFTQIEDVDYVLNGLSYMPIEYLDTSKIKYGRAPQNATEIVVDEWVVKKALKNSTLSNIMSVANFVGQTVKVKDTNIYLKIVGISSENTHTVYINKWQMLGIYPSNIKRNDVTICSVSTYNEYPNATKITDLKEDEVVVNTESSVGQSAMYFKQLVINDDHSLVFTPKDGYDFTNIPFKVVVSDSMYDKILASVIAGSHEEAKVIVKNEQEKQEVKNYLDSVSEKYNMKIHHESKYDNLFAPYIENSKKLVASRTLIVTTIILVSIAIVFFTMRSYAIKNIYDLGVYRAIGISKGSLVEVYAMEIFMMSLKSTLIGGLLTYIIVNILSSLPILYLNFSIPFSHFVISTLSLLVINVVVGIIPIILYMRLTPSQLLSKYDI